MIPRMHENLMREAIGSTSWNLLRLIGLYYFVMPVMSISVPMEVYGTILRDELYN